MLDQIQTNSKIALPFTSDKSAEVITKLLPYIFGAAGMILLLNIVTSGLKMMTSAGEPKTFGAAQAKLTTSAIGILILFTSIWIVQIIMRFLGIESSIFMFP